MKIASLIAAATLTIAATSQAAERVALSSPIVASIPITGFIYESNYDGVNWIVKANPTTSIPQGGGVTVGMFVRVTITPEDYAAAGVALFGSADVVGSKMQAVVQAASVAKLCALLQIDPAGITLVPYIAPIEDEEPTEEAAQ